MIPYTSPSDLIDPYLTAHTNAVRTAWALSRTSDLYHDLGLTCHPHRYDTEDIICNVTQLSDGEFLIASKFSGLLDSLETQYEILNNDSVAYYTLRQTNNKIHLACVSELGRIT
jgi:hypothetical protein